MRELSKKGEKFYSQWEERRKKKWRYIFLHGSVFWGLTMAIPMFLWTTHFEIEQMQLSRLFSAIIIFGVGGIGVGLRQYNRIDKMYLDLNDDEDIFKGIEKLNLGQVWEYENLKIRKVNPDTLLIQNELFWFKELEAAERINECFNMVMGDFQRILKNRDFSEFAKNHKLRIQIFDNSESAIPLIDKLLTS